ncbi:MAG: hypothetical protein KKD56_02200 [Acidobacteria bacterium]|nr:hypothetical protein [Acidobacteriota bacterium]MCG2817219.1 DUF6305 family protein [Candidatus Aminicenantes bacterium]MBU1337861.1 hypothetical protein [Acidobacteriota bacterium]MBU2438987.1 hypothetical protein [Acidobacteriota bacterium]MBU4203015.1 hypothetical protein [Acidobacteriota bacterium]
MHRLYRVVVAAAVVLMLCSVVSTAQPEGPKPELPVLITSCGQSPGPAMLKVIFMRAKLEYDPIAYEISEMASSEDLKAGKEAGTPFKTLIIVMGASLKGMGAAGISMEDELSRTEALIAEAKKQGMTVIGSHIEGMKRRSQGASAGDTTDEQSIDAVAPFSDILLIHKEGNSDNRFSIIAKEKNIPLIEVEKNLDLISEIQKLFHR